MKKVNRKVAKAAKDRGAQVTLSVPPVLVTPGSGVKPVVLVLPPRKYSTPLDTPSLS